MILESPQQTVMFPKIPNEIVGLCSGTEGEYKHCKFLPVNRVEGFAQSFS